MLGARLFSDRRFGTLKVQGKPPVLVGMEWVQEKNTSATLTQEDFTTNLKPLSASPEPWAGRKNPLPMDDTNLRQRKLGELRRVATVFRPDICCHGFSFGADCFQAQCALWK